MATEDDYDLHGLLMQFGLLSGRFDGRRVQPSPRGRRIRLCWTANMWFAFARFLLITLLPNESRIQFLLSNYIYFENAGFTRLMFYAGCLLCLWALLILALFGRACRRPQLVHWMRYFLPDHFPAAALGITTREQRAYQRHCSDIMRLLQRWFLRGFAVLMALVFYQYQTTPVPWPPWLFWTVWAVNGTSLYVYALYIFACTFALPVLMGLLSQLLASRFEQIGTRFRQLEVHGGQHLARKRGTGPWLMRLSFVVHSYQLIALELLRLNRFWSRIFFFNYHLGLAVIVFCVFSSYAIRNWVLIGMADITSVSIYLLGIILPIVYIGRLVEQVAEPRPK